jgi:catechol 2,3-dioxygenase-like lactoylglutathione lyase family enzyme
MIGGAHILIFSEDAEATRAFFRDVLELRHVDDGDGWLIFALPPSELGVHPGAGWAHGTNQHELFLMCHDIEETVRALERKGAEFVSPVVDEGFGLLTRLRIPGAGELGLYQPKHKSPLEAFERP